jgi:anti-sigma regulatory factor (Ser/Thr protein kinase)
MNGSHCHLAIDGHADGLETASGAGSAGAQGKMPCPAATVQQWPRVSSLELTGMTTAVPCARLHARQILWEWKLANVADEAELLVSELFSNAVKATLTLAAPELVTLRLLANSRRLIIEVWDHHPGIPQPYQAEADQESGRGLLVVETLANRWGYQQIQPLLKVVWAELLVGNRPVTVKGDLDA